MYTVLLVDDEISITDTLKSSILWTNLGVEKIFTAANGRDALAYFEKFPIHLMITDIKMPIMDGLELLEQVRFHYPNTHCILLTAFGEFEYARTALRLGVENYLLKPMQMTEVTETIENAIDNMSVNRSNKEFLFRENVLRRWLCGTISPNELSERASMLDINIYQNAYCVIGIKKKDSLISLFTYSQTCISQLNSLYECSYVWDNNGHFLMIISGDSIDPVSLASVFEENLKNSEISSKLYLAISHVTDSSDNLSHLYQEICHSFNQPDAFSESFILQCPDSALSEHTLLPDLDASALSPIIQKAVQYIHNGYAAGVSIKEFCAHNSMSTSYLGYLFKKETTVFFNNYLNNYRIAKAIGMLENTSLRIDDIAAKTGFSSTSYFISSFRRITGVSPKKYRELHL